jgi:hypothetical protein
LAIIQVLLIGTENITGYKWYNSIKILIHIHSQINTTCQSLLKNENKNIGSWFEFLVSKFTAHPWRGLLMNDLERTWSEAAIA